MIGAMIGRGPDSTLVEAAAVPPEKSRYSTDAGHQMVAEMLLNGNGLGVIALSADLRVSFANEKAANQVGLRSSLLIGRSALEFLHPDDISVVAESLILVTAGRATVPTIFRVISGDSSVRNVEGTVQAQDPESEDFRFVITIRDPAPSLRLDGFIEATLRSDLTEGLHQLVGLIETDGDFLGSIHWDWNGDQFAQVASNDSAVGRMARAEPLRQLLAETLKTPSLNRSLLPLGVDTTGTDRRSIYTCPIGKGDLRGVVVGWLPYEGELGPAGRNFFTRTARLADFALARHIADRGLRLAANTDPLTGLGNRSALNENLSSALANGVGGCSLLLFDLDGFKKINDDHGHAAGDHVLIEVARRLGEGSPPNSFVARLGGDEFAMVVGPWHDTDVLIEALEERVGQPITSAFGELAVGVSIGAARSGSGSTVSDLLATADRFMYEQKRSRRAIRVHG